MKIFLFFLLFLSLSQAAGLTSKVFAALTFGPNILISTIPGQATSEPPMVDVDITGGVYVAWVGQDNNNTAEIYFSKLSPDGNNFQDTKPLTGINDQKSSAQIEQENGNLYIAWNESRIVNNQVQRGIFFTKSSDGGQTFSSDILIVSAPGRPFSMTAHDGKIYITYAIVKEACCFYHWSELWLVQSVDGGNTFSQSQIYKGPIGSDSDQRPAVDFIGNKVYVSWYDYSGIKFASSNDGGATFEQPRYIFKPDNSGINRLGNGFGRMSLETSHSGAIFIVFDFFFAWDDPFRFDYEVFFTKSVDSGTSFTPARRLSDDPVESRTRQEHPSLTILPDGSPAIAWLDAEGLRKIMFVYSQDQGESFSANIRINNTDTDTAYFQATIAADRQGNIHLVRWDTGFDQFGLYYTKIDLGLQFETPPTPFLDLPWDYEGKGLSFSEAALAINSYFDHEYPLLSSGISEPTNRQNQITTFQGENSTAKKYSTHDGYDYGKDAKALIGEPVLAASSGCASFFKAGATGNAIKIDHGNGYQTRYYHLSDNDLITKSATCTNVTKGQQIGRVGATGNVIPPGDLGAHIHFMVIQDKNNDGNFEDNIPDGLTDPFGWQSTDPDPWSHFNFFYNGQNRSGNTSYYLWTKAINNLSNQLTSNGGFFELERYRLEFPQGATNENLTLEMEYAPVAKPSNLLQSIGATLVVNARNFLGEFVKEFTKPYTISIDFGAFDLSTFNLATISIHSSEDGINWQKEETTVDLVNKKATAQLNHLSHFALMAERLDITAPTTEAILSGTQGQRNWFRSDVQVSLNPQDNPGGLGVDYTFYKVGEGDWQEYLLPITFTNEGQYLIQFYSVDKDENIEDIKSIEFNIDKTLPIATIQANPTILWPPDERMVPVTISGWASDNSNNQQFVFEVEDEYNLIEPQAVGNFNQTINLQASRRGKDSDGRKYIIKIMDLAGNMAQTRAEIIVPHGKINN